MCCSEKSKEDLLKSKCSQFLELGVLAKRQRQAFLATEGIKPIERPVQCSHNAGGFEELELAAGL